MNKVIIIVAHPDDEVLGCGGTIAKHCLSGDSVHIVIMAEGATSRDDIRDTEKFIGELSNLRIAAENAGKILGAKRVTLFDFPDNRMDSVDRIEVTKAIEKYIKKYKPSIIYTHHSGDVNIDHRIVHEAVVTATRPQPGNNVKTLLFFETPSSTEWQPPISNIYFKPNWFVDISDTLTRKLSALDCYQGEMRNWPHPRSLKAVEYLSKWRGATVGCNAAEAFILGRCIIK